MNKFDLEISIRNQVVGAVMGFLASKAGWLVTSEEQSALIGAILVGLYDLLAFHVKKWFKERQTK